MAECPDISVKPDMRVGGRSTGVLKEKHIPYWMRLASSGQAAIFV